MIRMRTRSLKVLILLLDCGGLSKMYILSYLHIHNHFINGFFTKKLI